MNKVVQNTKVTICNACSELWDTDCADEKPVETLCTEYHPPGRTQEWCGERKLPRTVWLCKAHLDWMMS